MKSRRDCANNFNNVRYRYSAILQKVGRKVKVSAFAARKRVLCLVLLLCLLCTIHRLVLGFLQNDDRFPSENQEEFTFPKFDTGFSGIDERTVRNYVVPLAPILYCSSSFGEVVSGKNARETKAPALSVIAKLYDELSRKRVLKEYLCSPTNNKATNETPSNKWWVSPYMVEEKAREKLNNFSIVFCLPSTDSLARKEIRKSLRETVFRYKDVANFRNSFNGKWLFLFTLAADHTNYDQVQLKDDNPYLANVTGWGDGTHRELNLRLSANLAEEAFDFNDIIFLRRFRDPKPTTKKILGSAKKASGGWGIETEVGMSHKMMWMWMFLAFQFPNVPYLARGDDDAYFKVPQILAEVEQWEQTIATFNALQTYDEIQYIYFGLQRLMTPENFYFAIGWIIILNRKLLHEIVRLPEYNNKEVKSKHLANAQEIMNLALRPFQRSLVPKYKKKLVKNDDVMFGYLIHFFMLYKNEMYNREHNVKSAEYLHSETLTVHVKPENDRRPLLYYIGNHKCRTAELYGYLSFSIFKSFSIVVHRSIWPNIHHSLLAFFTSPSTKLLSTGNKDKHVRGKGKSGNEENTEDKDSNETVVDFCNYFTERKFCEFVKSKLVKSDNSIFQDYLPVLYTEVKEGQPQESSTREKKWKNQKRDTKETLNMNWSAIIENSVPVNGSNWWDEVKRFNVSKQSIKISSLKKHGTLGRYAYSELLCNDTDLWEPI